MIEKESQTTVKKKSKKEENAATTEGAVQQVVLLPPRAVDQGSPHSPQTIIRRPLASSHLTGTITRYTQGVLVEVSHLLVANISQVTDFTFANFTQASLHAW